MDTKSTLYTLLIAVMVTAVPFHAHALKCWTTKDGSRACGDAVPPEYAQQSYEKKNALGMTVERHEAARSVEEVEAEFKAKKAAEIEAKKAQQQARLDQNLLDTFTSEDDMLYARDGQIAHLEGQIKLSENRNDKLQKSLNELITEAAEHERRGAEPPESLISDIKSLEQQLDDNERFIDTKRLEQKEILEKFDIDIARFRKLSENGF